MFIFLYLFILLYNYIEKPPTSFGKRDSEDRTPSKSLPVHHETEDISNGNKDVSEYVKDLPEAKQRNISQAELESQLFKVLKLYSK